MPGKSKKFTETSQRLLKVSLEYLNLEDSIGGNPDRSECIENCPCGISDRCESLAREMAFEKLSEEIRLSIEAEEERKLSYLMLFEKRDPYPFLTDVLEGKNIVW